MLTSIQTDRSLTLLTEKNNNFYRSRVPKCLFGAPEQSDEIFEKETNRHREAFRCKWDYNIIEDKPVENPKNYLWENLCNENKTNSSENLVSVERKLGGDEIDEDEENRRNRRTELKRYSDENRSFSGSKKKRQILLPELWSQKKLKSAYRKSS